MSLETGNITASVISIIEGVLKLAEEDKAAETGSSSADDLIAIVDNATGGKADPGVIVGHVMGGANEALVSLGLNTAATLISLASPFILRAIAELSVKRFSGPAITIHFDEAVEGSD